MHYLFGFGGRINRAKIWLFILVTLGWEIVIGLVAVAGLHWSSYIAASKAWKAAIPPEAAPPLPWPDPVSGLIGWIAAGVIAVLVLAYVVSLCAVYTKRLHDRNKNAWWLLLFVAIPWGMAIISAAGVPGIFRLGHYFGPLGMGWGAASFIGFVVGVWAFIELFCLKGTAGANPYGSDPRAKPIYCEPGKPAAGCIPKPE
jgi:uncharacterized membrane protein YhaH (DUF805 family)